MNEISEQYQMTSGPLRSTITIELHTHLATRTWTGRQASPQEHLHAIIGLPRFLNIMNVIRLDALADNPYADMWMLHLEERLLAARLEMNALIDSMKSVFSQLPEMMTVEGCLSVQPVRFPVYAASQLGFIGLYLLTDFDSLLRNAQLANHMALLSQSELNHLRQQGGNLIRSILALAQRYRRIPVTRQDLREGNARALAALEQAGPVPEDILDGSRRSAYAPPLRQPETSEPQPATQTPLAAPVTDAALPVVIPEIAPEADDDEQPATE